MSLLWSLRSTVVVDDNNICRYVYRFFCQKICSLLICVFPIGLLFRLIEETRRVVLFSYCSAQITSETKKNHHFHVYVYVYIQPSRINACASAYHRSCLTMVHCKTAKRAFILSRFFFSLLSCILLLSFIGTSQSTMKRRSDSMTFNWNIR
jgi:hypothetical protein